MSRAPGRIFREGVRVDGAAGLVRERQMEGQEVGGRENLVHPVRPGHPELAKPILGDERVVRDHLHPETDRTARDLLADPSEAEHAQRLALELDPAVARAFPPPLLERGVRLRDVPRERDEQPDGVLRRRDDCRLGRIRDDDPAARRGVDVDVVDPHSRPSDHLQPVGPLEDLGGQLRRGADDDRVVVPDPLLERQVAVRRRRRTAPAGARFRPRRSAPERGPGGVARVTRGCVRRPRALRLSPHRARCPRPARRARARRRPARS